MQLNTNDQKFIKIIIGFSRDFPFTINPGEAAEQTYPSLLELINPDDIPPITEMFTDVSQDEEKRFEAHCRFMVNDVYHWFFLSCKAVYAEYCIPWQHQQYSRPHAVLLLLHLRQVFPYFLFYLH